MTVWLVTGWLFVLNCLHDVVSKLLQLTVDYAFGKELQTERTVEAPEVYVERFASRDNTTNYSLKIWMQSMWYVGICIFGTSCGRCTHAHFVKSLNSAGNSAWAEDYAATWNVRPTGNKMELIRSYLSTVLLQSGFSYKRSGQIPSASIRKVRYFQ